VITLVAGSVCGQYDGYWFTREPLPEARQELIPASLDGKIYVVGGYSAALTVTGSVYVYDPAAATWDYGTSIPIARHHYAVGGVGGILYVMSGYTSATLPWTTTPTSYAYDPVADSWSSRAPIPTPRGECASAVFEDKIYVIGGNNEAGDDIGTVEVYDPGTDSWSTVSPMPTARHHPATAVIDSLIYVVGGRTGYWGQTLTLTGAMEAYSPASDTWYFLPDMLTPRSALAGAAYDGKLYTFGGEIPNIYEEVEEYDPDTETWRALTPMLTPRHGTAAITVADTVFLIGGAYQQGGGASDANEGFVLGTCSDFDHDGYADYDDPSFTCPLDNCSWPYNPDQTDSDQDGVGDACDECPDDPYKSWEGECGCGVADTDSDDDGVPDCNDVCPGYDDLVDTDEDGFADGCDNCPDVFNPGQEDENQNQIGDACDGCCDGRVGDANGSGDDEPTIGDVSILIDARFISETCEGKIECLEEADINQSADGETTCDDITIGDISVMIDYLFISESLVLPDCE
jgi:N-acetylneuraminic acid mutarotase